MYAMNLWGEMVLAPEAAKVKWVYNSKGRAIKATVGSKRRCDPRCTSAKGPDCVCRCQGKNHGIDNNHWGNEDDEDTRNFPTVGELFASDEE